MDDFPEFETYADVIDAYERDNMGYETLTDYIKGNNIKIKEIDISPLSDLKNMRDGGPVGIEILFSEKVPAAPSQLVSESDILLGYRGDDAARSDRASGRKSGRADPRGGVDRSAVSEGSQYARNVAAQNNEPSFKEKVKSFVTNPAVQTLGGAVLTGGINTAFPGVLDKINKARLISNAIKYGKDIAVEDELENITTQGGISPYADGGRVGLFMGGPPLEGTALNIYNSMNAYGFTDQEIANALQERGLYTPGGSTPDTPSDNIIGSQLNQGGGGTGVMELQKTFTRAPGSTPKFSEDAFFGLGKFFQGKERGTLGTRLANQKMLPIPLPSMITAQMRSPFNPDSPTYNPDLEDQLNFLELGDDMIGMSGTGLKYGSGSVLAGQNVISGFGSNNYLTQLNKYINRKNITDKARKRAEDERAAFLAAQEKRKAAEAQRQKDIQEAATRRTYSLQDLQDSSDRGTGQSYAAARERTASRVGPSGNIRAYGLKDGGIATMFRNKR